MLIVWYNSATASFNPSQSFGSVARSLPRDYRLQTNDASGGGPPPSSGWTTIRTVVDNAFHSRAHVHSLSDANWIRIVVTRSSGSAPNNDVALNLDLHPSESDPVSESWLFLGDSLIEQGMNVAPINGTGTFAQLVQAARAGHFPSAQAGGLSGFKTSDALPLMDGWLSSFPGRYVALAYGTNDVFSPNDPVAVNQADVNLRAMIDKVLSRGKTPVVPTIPWGRRAGVVTNGESLNARIEKIYSDYPGVVRGPDLWTFFKNHSALISADDLHPTPAGYTEYRKQWRDAMIAASLFPGPENRPPTVVEAPSASPVDATRYALRVRATDDQGPGNLLFHWSVDAGAPGAVTIEPNHATAAQDAVAIFFAPGAYALRLDIEDPSGNRTRANLPVELTSVLAALRVEPAQVTVPLNGTQAFSATGVDQFGFDVPSGPVEWHVNLSGSAVTSDGRFTAASAEGIATIRATAAGQSGTATVTIQNHPPEIVVSPHVLENAADGRLQMGLEARDDADSARLLYSWTAIGPGGAVFEPNGTGDAAHTRVRFIRPGRHRVQVEVTDTYGASTLASFDVDIAPFVAGAGNYSTTKNVVDVTRHEALILPVNFGDCGHLTGHLYDQRGREVSRVFDQDVTAGAVLTWFPETDLGAGAYLLRMVCGVARLNQRVVIIN